MEANTTSEKILRTRTGNGRLRQFAEIESGSKVYFYFRLTGHFVGCSWTSKSSSVCFYASVAIQPLLRIRAKLYIPFCLNCFATQSREAQLTWSRPLRSQVFNVMRGKNPHSIWHVSCAVACRKFSTFRPTSAQIHLKQTAIICRLVLSDTSLLNKHTRQCCK